MTMNRPLIIPASRRRTSFPVGWIAALASPCRCAGCGACVSSGARAWGDAAGVWCAGLGCGPVRAAQVRARGRVVAPN